MPETGHGCDETITCPADQRLSRSISTTLRTARLAPGMR